MEKINPEIPNPEKKKEVYLMGGSDLEMHQIKKRLTRSGMEIVDKNLKWEAKIDDYKEEIEQILKEEKIPVEVELSGADQIEGVVDIDHHGDKSSKPASISQYGEGGVKNEFYR